MGKKKSGNQGKGKPKLGLGTGGLGLAMTTNQKLSEKYSTSQIIIAITVAALLALTDAFSIIASLGLAMTTNQKLPEKYSTSQIIIGITVAALLALTDAFSIIAGALQHILVSIIVFLTRTGKNPRSSFDKNKPDDYHAWCVDDMGNVCDYPDDQNQHGYYASMMIVRRPWDAHAISEARFHIDKSYKSFSIGVRNISQSNSYATTDHKLSNEELFKLIELDEFPTKYCYARAMTLHNSNPKKYKLVIGSLGYIQSDGSIFWEFG